MVVSEDFLKADNVSVRRPDESGQFIPVLKEISLGVAKSELLAIVGPSGGGKSTLLRLFNRLLEPDSGAVLLQGSDIRGLAPPALRARLPLVTQKPYIFSGTVKDNLEKPARLRSEKLPDLTTADMQDMMSMCQVETSWLKKDAGKLSIGQQQRVCLLRAMIGPCEALLLDEPTSALDRQTAALLAQTFRQLSDKKGLAIIVVTHDLRIAELCADRIALLQDGTVMEVAKTDRFLAAPETEAARQFISNEVIKGSVSQNGQSSNN